MVRIFDKQKWLFVKANIGPAFRRFFLDRPSPMFVGLMVTRNCNLDCSYCFVRKKSKDPSTEDLKKRIDKIREIGCNVVYFMGGEPMLRKDIVELTRYCKSKGMFVCLDTNGTLLTKRSIDELSGNGMNVLVVSLDGIKKLAQSKKTLHDNPALVDILRYASQDKHMGVFVNMVLSCSNTGEVMPVLEKISGTGISMTTCLMSKNQENLHLYKNNTMFDKKTKKELGLLFDRIIRAKEKGCPMFEPVYCYERMKEFINCRYDWRCGAGRHFISIDPNGFLALCPETKHLGIRFENLDKHYYKKYKSLFKKEKTSCNRICVQNYAVMASYYNKNKIEFLFRNFKRS